MTDGRALLDVRRRPSTEDDEWRASWTELFFDLVFVLVVTQLSALLLRAPEPAGAAETLFLLLVAWWAWIYTTWATNWFDPERGPVARCWSLAMLASMLGAAAIPDAFGDRALLLVVGYVGIQTVRNAFMVLATEARRPAARAARAHLRLDAVGRRASGSRVRSLDHDARLVVWVDRAGLRLRRPRARPLDAGARALGPERLGARARALRRAADAVPDHRAGRDDRGRRRHRLRTSS